MTFKRPTTGWNYQGPTTHPGEMLKKEFIEPMGLTQRSVAKSIGISDAYLSDIITGKRDVSILIALNLAEFFGNSSEFWMNLQTNYDLSKARNGGAK